MTTLHQLTATTPGLPCRTTDPELWFSRSSSERTLAVALCRECPIQTACAQYALDHPELRGVWGGTTAADRRQFRTGEPCRLDEQGRLRRLCGSERAYRAHFKYRETPGPDCVDGDCVAAHEEHVTAERRARLDREHEAGGSTVGFWLHRRLGEPLCGGCREAFRVRQEISRRARARRGLQGARGASAAPESAEGVNGAPAGVQAFPLAS
ncbi:WhiB family transcriptional regulator [Streptomyces griseoviridis]|uniref:Transcriptional regulator WhiB n=1 Tax=Streptomyces griseoviridis TaxID=45398 RepID=A0ABT9LFG4_STRGD|nr:WhiB family transcriptional regulator [Streptomyces griseoviridis]MDP9682393.1 hypothetical protein [Streptomyces griseoviridis]GGS81795.1 hypothetical protein GCM10010240_13940 [Streptomyces griseoviridis]